jgi:hypothetical protein
MTELKFDDSRSIPQSHERASETESLLSGYNGSSADAAIRDKPSSMNDLPDSVAIPNSSANEKSKIAVTS